jgi:undecaprenyl-phosphate galactose phosphotransferase
MLRGLEATMSSHGMEGGMAHAVGPVVDAGVTTPPAFLMTDAASSLVVTPCATDQGRVYPRAKPLELVVKRCIDIAASLVLLVVLSPLLLTIGAMVSLGGPVIFRQGRIGKDGRTFACLKFRTMVPEAETTLQILLESHPEARAEWERAQKLTVDPRITGIGAALRKSSLDELPQLWNVLRGDMSLVGPRPALHSQLPLYGSSARWYLLMRPGMTGPWQVNFRGDDDFRRRVECDCGYARNFSLLMDLRILLKTVRVVFSGKGAK